jgi:hypothetical protein
MMVHFSLKQSYLFVKVKVLLVELFIKGS